jgi:MFS family permease
VELVLTVFGLLAVVGMPLGLVVVGVLVLRAGVRGGLRMGLAVACLTLAIAVLGYTTALAQLEISAKLEHLASCDSAAECAGDERAAIDDTPIRPLGRWLVMVAVADAAVLGLWFLRGARHSAGMATRVIAAFVAAAVAFGLVLGSVAWQLPAHIDASPDHLRAATHSQQGVLGLLGCLVAILGVVATVRRVPIRRPGPWYVRQPVMLRRAP